MEIERFTGHLSRHEVRQTPSEELLLQHGNLEIILGEAQWVAPRSHSVSVRDEAEGRTRVIHYEKICVATGAIPRLPFSVGDSRPFFIRDEESVVRIADALTAARHVCVVGNGGVAMEFVYALLQGAAGFEGTVTWAVKDDFAGAAFLDRSGARWVKESVLQKWEEAKAGLDLPGAELPVPPSGQAELRHASLGGTEGDERQERTARGRGAALGPHWHAFLRSLRPSYSPAPDGQALRMMHNVSPESVSAKSLLLSDGTRIDCDAVVCAVGVAPDAGLVMPKVKRCRCCNGLRVSRRFEVLAEGADGDGSDGCCAEVSGVRRDEGGTLAAPSKATPIEGVYAVGDCCCAAELMAQSGGAWFQMRLWSQAVAMAAVCAQHMAGAADELTGGVSFDLFAHATRFFGHKVVLLGRFNGQGLGEEVAEVMRRLEVQADGGVAPYTGVRGEEGIAEGAGEVEVWKRVTAGVEYVKAVVRNGVLVGALLIGETDLEDCMENLILDGLPVDMKGLLEQGGEDAYD